MLSMLMLAQHHISLCTWSSPDLTRVSFKIFFWSGELPDVCDHCCTVFCPGRSLVAQSRRPEFVCPGRPLVAQSRRPEFVCPGRPLVAQSRRPEFVFLGTTAQNFRISWWHSLFYLFNFTQTSISLVKCFAYTTDGVYLPFLRAPR